MHPILLTFPDVSAETMFQKKQRLLTARIELFASVFFLLLLISSCATNTPFIVLSNAPSIFPLCFLLLLISTCRFLSSTGDKGVLLWRSLSLHCVWLCTCWVLLKYSVLNGMVQNGVWMVLSCLVTPLPARSYVPVQVLFAGLVWFLQPLLFDLESEAELNWLAQVWDCSCSWTHLWLDGDLPNKLTPSIPTVKAAQRMWLGLHFIVGLSIPLLLNWLLEASRRIEFVKMHHGKFPSLQDVAGSFISVPYAIATALVYASLLWKLLCEL